MFRCRSISAALVQLVVIALFAIPAFGQGSRVSGALAGTVHDSSGALIPNASIQVTLTDTGQTQMISSGADGRFFFPHLADGTYSIRIHKDGFADLVGHMVQVMVGTTAQVDASLQIASSSQQVIVQANASVLEPQQTSVQAVIDKERIEESPVQSRNFLNFILLAPGVSAANTNAGTGTPGSGGDGFSFGGLRPQSNALYIDGVDNNDAFDGNSRAEISLEDVQEFQVVNHGFAAESGGAAGGSVDVVTRAGGNIVHGDAFIFMQNGAFDAMPSLQTSSAKPDLNRERVGLAIGGPVRKDRDFYYSSFEQEHARGEDTNDLSPMTVASVNTALHQVGPLAALQIARGFFPTGREETEFSQRFDHQINPRNQLMLRYASTNNREINDAFNTNELVDNSSRGSSFTLDQAFIAGLTTTLSEHTLHDLRMQFATRRVALRTNVSSGPGVEVPGIIEFGRPYNGNALRHENYFEISNSLSHQSGNHLWKVGAAINRVHLRAAIGDGFGGIYVFPSISSLTNGDAGYFEQSFGNPDTNFPATQLAGFMQDHWNLSSSLAFDYGLRYDFTNLPDPVHKDALNLAPRLGFAWQPGRSWIVRTGGGLFYDRYPLASVNPIEQKNGVGALDQIAEQSTAATLYRLRKIYYQPIAGIAPSIHTAQSDLHNTYSEVASLGVERSIGEDLSLSTTYNFVRGVRLSRSANVNLAPPVSLTVANAATLGVTNPTPQQIGREVFTPASLNPGFDRIDQLQSTAASSYNGLTFTAKRRMKDEFELLASYTYSKTIDDASDFSEHPQNPYDPRVERALSLNDQRHRFVASALWDLPIGDADDPGEAPPTNPFLKALSNIEIAPIFSIDSGKPANPLTASDAGMAHIYPFNARPLGLGRNSLTTPTNASLDFRALKTAKIWRGKLDMVAESFNLLNHTNVTQLSPYFGDNLTPTLSFNRPIEASAPRQIQLSLDYEF